MNELEKFLEILTIIAIFIIFPLGVWAVALSLI